MTTRLEPVDPQHPQTVALLFGPLVLFAVTEDAPSPTRSNLLAAKRINQQSWHVKGAGGVIKMLPFTGLGEEQYSTYLRVV